MLLICLQVVWVTSGFWWIAAGAQPGPDNDMEYDDSDLEPQPRTPPRAASPKKPAPKSGQKPKAQPRTSKGRHKAAQKAGSRLCKLCCMVKDLAEFALNQSNCRGCKAALDNITKKAKAQNRLAWLHETLNDPEQTKDMLTSYTAAMQKAKELGSRGPRKEAWSLVEYIEVVKATSKTKRTGRDQLMWKLQAIDFYKSLGGGGLSHSQAEKKWSDMETSYIAEGLEHDHDGPVDAPLRLPVRVADFVDQSDSISRQKQRTQPLIRLAACLWLVVGSEHTCVSCHRRSPIPDFPNLPDAYFLHNDRPGSRGCT